MNTSYELPDFDSYPTERRVISAHVVRGGVRVEWDDGLSTSHHRFVLRENSPEPTTTHPLSREQQMQLTELPGELAIVKAATHEGGGLTVWWSEGLESSTYHPGWLRAWAPEADDGHRLPERVHWDSSLDPDTLRFDGAAIEPDGEAFAGWLHAIHTHGFGLVENLPTDEETIFRIPGMIGPIRETNFGPAFDVRTKTAEVTSNAYTDLELPTHTDLDTREYMPGLQFLHCMTNDASGGESRLADAAHICRHLREIHPASFDALTTIPVTFINKATDTDYRHVSPFLVVDDDGELIEARWSPWLRGPLQASLGDADRWYAALRLALTLGDSEEFVVKVRLRAGELLGFDNRRLLHGRGALDRSTGERWLRGSYVEREELESRLRIIQRRRRAADCLPQGPYR